MKKKEQIHSSFWLGKRTEDLFGSDFQGGTNSTAKAVKMRSYHRAVSNFVKILTKKEIPVVFKGSSSYTNGKSINISADISNKNFDVNVGLALHEASHVVLTDFSCGEELYNTYRGKHAFNLLNWVEDRRIDNYVITNAPGYASYYTALYDYYFRKDKSVGKFFKSKQSRDASKVITYMQHIVNMLHPDFNPNALPRLNEIVDIVDLPNIARLKSTSDSLEVALKVYEIITSAVAQEQANQEQEEDPANKQEKTVSDTSDTENGTDSPDEEENEDTTQENEEEEEAEETPEESGTPEYQKESGQGSGGSGGGEEAEEEAEELEEELEELSDAEMGRILRDFEEQVDFTNGDVRKRTADHKVLKSIDEIADEDINLYKSSHGKVELLVHDFTRVTPNLSRNYHFADPTSIPEGEPYRCTRRYVRDAITAGMQLGAGLGRRLKLVGESRTLITNRLKSGSIDRSRLAGLGYGVESVFNQITVEQYKKANIHISLDTSGSMNGSNWAKAVQTTVAIAKAAMATSGQVQVQVSTRDTAGSKSAVAYIIYDSRYNKINQLIKYLAASRVNSLTPEGLCFEGLLKANKLIPGTAEMDSYFINISDGQPCFNGYSHFPAIKHTQQQVKAIKRLGISILGYYVSAAKVPATDHSYTIFKQMYGEQDSKVCNPASLVEIAKTLNDKFLEAKVSTTR